MRIDGNQIQVFYAAREETQAKEVAEAESRVGGKRSFKAVSRNNPAHPRFGMGPIPPPRTGGPQAVLAAFTTTEIPDPHQNLGKEDAMDLESGTEIIIIIIWNKHAWTGSDVRQEEWNIRLQLRLL